MMPVRASPPLPMVPLPPPPIVVVGWVLEFRVRVWGLGFRV